MTCLIRTRGASSEIARTFAAEHAPDLTWPETIWQGDPVPAIAAGPAPRLVTLRWGLGADAFVRPVPSKRRGVLYPRDLSRWGSRLVDPPAYDRCLIIIESFAYPQGPKGQATRTWIGLDDTPLAAWAGFCTATSCARILVRAPDALASLTTTMPRLLTPEDCGRWLEGAPLLALDPFFEGSAYAENLGERWSSGRLPDDPPLRFAA